MPQPLEKAIEPLRRALGLNPTLVNAHVWLGSALSGLGQLDEGLVLLRTAVEIEPDNADAHQTLARVLAEQGDGAGDRRAAAQALNPEAGYAPAAVDARGTQQESRCGGGSGASGDRASRAGDVGHRRVADRRRASRLGYVHYLRGNYDAACAEFRRELEWVNTSDHALRERTVIELHQENQRGASRAW